MVIQGQQRAEVGQPSAWAPLRNPVYRGLFIASFVSNVGTWMQSVAAQWFLVERHSSDVIVALVQTASLGPALLGLSAGGVYQQRFCAGVDFRAMSAVQNAAALIPAAALAFLTPFTVHDAGKAVIAVVGMVLLNATLAVSLYVRAINTHGAAAVAMLFAVIPAVAGVLSWIILGQRPDVGVAVGLLLGGLACWINTGAPSRPSTKESAPTRAWQRSAGERPPAAAMSRVELLEAPR
jgi:drug/metabolite transporter (DMT)-like permease